MVNRVNKSEGFHSISFPNEWGGKPESRTKTMIGFSVSIQLVSPTSGEPWNWDEIEGKDIPPVMFPFN